MLLRREIDSMQLLTLNLTLTHMFSGGKAKLNLHTCTTPKLTVVNSLVRSIQFPSPQFSVPDAISSCFLQLRCMFSFNRFLNLLTVAWIIKKKNAIRLCFLQSLNFFLLVVISSPFLAILTDYAFRHQCKRMTSYLMT